ncbi:MAG: endonuclease, partial [Clostridiales bacterium]|nr:endonuclease [Clostridiales bacterium]
IEAKWCGEQLDTHSSQLFRYFGTSEAKIGILTNGILYRFFTDLDEPNKMDLTPFMEFNILDIKENLIPELKRFQRSSLDLDTVFNAASELKYTTAIKQFLSQQAADPAEDFVSFVVGHVYNGRKTSSVVERFKPIVKRSFSQYLNDILNERFKSMLNASDEEKKQEKETQPEEEAMQEEASAIHTTAEEVEAFFIIKALVHDVIEPSRLSYKDTQSYFSILVDNKTTRWICRLQIEGRKKSVIIRGGEAKKEERIPITNNNDLYGLKDKFVLAALSQQD